MSIGDRESCEYGVHFREAVGGNHAFILLAVNSVQNGKRALMVNVLFHDGSHQNVGIQKDLHLLFCEEILLAILDPVLSRSSVRMESTISLSKRFAPSPLENTRARPRLTKPDVSW